MAKAEAALAQLAGRSRKNVDAQKLASQTGRLLQRMKAHKYSITTSINPDSCNGRGARKSSAPRSRWPDGICCERI
jgi:hypothetical protein